MTLDQAAPLAVQKESEVASPEAAVAQLIALYEEQLGLIHQRFERFADGTLSADDEEHGCYPSLSVEIPAEKAKLTSSLALGRITGQHLFCAAITNPKLMEAYLIRQLTKIEDAYSAVIKVGLSNRPIPLSFALEAATASLSADQREQLQQHFFLPNLISTNDDIVDGKKILDRSGPLPLSLFTAERTDYSLNRIRHYTATDPEHYQPYILFTNYQRYVDEFIDYAAGEVVAGRAEMLVEPGGRITRADGIPSTDPLAKQPQMPAYHLVREGKAGITLVNIGVGPSNAKTITDHLAVLRPHVWLMIGHCGGLRRTQRLGDYVLAHAYLRDDNLLDHALHPSVPLPTIAEVQLALTEAVSDVTGAKEKELKEHLRTGTVVTTDDRNWELRFEDLAVLLNQSRAIAIDMESATIAAQGYRYRVPYGTLLCVSDRPLHGEIKLPGMANAFYQERVGQHLEIGIKALDLLRSEAEQGALHSRKLRSFDEPLLR